VVVALMAVQETGDPLVNVVPQGVPPLPSEIAAVAAAGVHVGVSEGCAPALTPLPVKLVIAAGVTTICLVAVATVVPSETVNV
jgi:hypothetical protein